MHKWINCRKLANGIYINEFNANFQALWAIDCVPIQNFDCTDTFITLIAEQMCPPSFFPSNENSI